MAAIDKIYGTNEQYDEFYNWAKETDDSILEYFYPRYGYESHIRPITNFPVIVDVLLAKFCPIEWVLDALKEQYGGVLPTISRDEVYFIEKIKPYIYTDIRNGKFGKSYDYFVKPGNNNVWQFCYDSKMNETYLTIDDLVN